MKPQNKNRTVLTLTALAMAILGLATAPAQAATMSASLTAPTVNGEDIANYGTVTGTDKWWNDAAVSGRPKGQTFTTGGTEVLLKAITYQVTSTQKAEPTKTYVIRVGTVSGSTFTEIYSETATQTFTWNASEYMTWTLDSPYLLSSNTEYGIDVGMTSSTSPWTSGIPYINRTGDEYAGGTRYMSGTTGSGIGDGTMNNISGDMLFHLDLEHPMTPSPLDGDTVPAGDVELSWTNLAPNVGSDVYVDLWFGTDPITDFTMVVDATTPAGENATSKTVSAPVADTYYWQINSYLDGSPTGDPVTTMFLFYVDDTDGDGFPDTYELAYTTPPSPTALNPGDDLEPDGLTNMEEYLIGTYPNDPDTDGDTLQDGDEVAGAGSRPPTSPLSTDTDGDTLSDLAETNTGIWVSSSDTGTDPTAADTDGDGLLDAVETNTGTFVSDTDTGTDPLAADTDGDGAEDWYEVAAAYTDPTISTDKPVIPYPLPDPDGSTGSTTKPVKVYILSGQSNMVGIGYGTGTNPGSLETITRTDNKFPNLIDASGDWTIRNDVWYEGVVTATAKKWLSLGCGNSSSNLGPELGFGHVMGYIHDEPVIILKTSQGNRGIGWDFLPPGSQQFNWTDGNGDEWTYAGYGDSPNRWLTGTTPVPINWYAGKQYDDCVAAAHNVLDNFNTKFPQYAAQGYEIAGFVWWQGHKDQGEPYASRYEQNMVNFIKAIRTEFNAPDAPFVLATIGFEGWALAGAGLTVADAQLAVSGETGNYPEFAGNVKTVESRGYWRTLAESPGSQGYHYNNNAETYMLVGDALGRAMIGLQTYFSINAGTDMATWSGEPVQLNAIVENGAAGSTYIWTADPDAGVIFDPNEFLEDPTVTITKTPGDPVTVTLTLTADDGENPPAEDTMTIDVYDDECKAALGIGLAANNPTDFSGNCITSLEDIAFMLAAWLNDNSLTEPVPK